ncbi:hypothetical protein GOPIP_093_00100 [Gordonia polyisoprenivorans NBRC 16320 = JCM 10675]|jgi:putative membrane protein|uniref:SHOCT domain-containing protein n=1 Tax=Gordonia polyisoprenivorans TaxID=84595 RepID=A0A846WXG2_9ACTN|nr:SHOCT domain-containing protein [Gordonia polyisoprenivorans]MBE7192040.1 SHOCT domain-containing protein [Gordonia polyisoprenivorans]NKY05131.1 SHOCT domain-containing protein [Gordonia polyisoprenivorans]OZC30638.1 hypothetical protein CJJ17_03545 [Gordonia polyisoprenivorans]QUD85620.1 SHOCT domain-containing protein [Gordonia polyisoprenivorans]UZF59106.1 SHOCT domain-containing protein [Gordonia polyisoprenivorans]
MYDNGYMWGNSWGWGGWILMASMMVLFWAAVITAVVLAIRYFSGPRHHSGGVPGPGQPGPGPSRAEDVLGERFARGEIDEDEYRKRMTALREHR